MLLDVTEIIFKVIVKHVLALLYNQGQVQCSDITRSTQITKVNE